MDKRKIGMRLGVLVLFGLVAAACSLQIANLRPLPANSMAQYEEMQLFFLYGVGQSKTVDAAAICDGSRRVARVEGEQTFVDGLIAVVTFGILTPRTARVYCVQ